jgi:hypothetical protein
MYLEVPMLRYLTHTVIHLAAIVGCVVVLTGGCGDGGSGGGNAPRLPAVGDPQRGTAGNVLVSDRGRSVDEVLDQLWLGFSRPEEWSHYIEERDRLAAEGTVPFVGGTVIADSKRPLGFYFDPATTSAAEVTAETFQTSLEALRSAPEAVAAAGHRWFVPLVEERAVPAGNRDGR